MVHVDLTLVLRINSIIDVLRVLYVVPRPRRKVLYFSDAVRNGYVERVAARPRAERGDEYPVAWLRYVEHCRKAHHAGARVSVPHLRAGEALLYLLFGQPQRMGGPGGELAVRLVEYRIIIIARLRALAFQHHLRRRKDMLEISRIAGKPAAMPGIVRAFPSPEVGSIGRVGAGVVDHRDVVRFTDHQGGPAGGCRVL